MSDPGSRREKAHNENEGETHLPHLHPHLPPGKRGRVHDAEGAREAILNAAEKVFAEHGFDGARIDAIAATANYNKSLLFHYFGDKLGLYAAVLRRADEHMNEQQMQVIVALAQEEDTAFKANKFRILLKTAMEAFFDYLVEHPHFIRIVLWEMAEGWQTYAKIISQRDREDVEQFRSLLYKAQSAGLLRSDFDPVAQLVLSVYFCLYHLGTIPFFQLLLPDRDFSSPEALAQTREFTIDFVLHGLLADPENTLE
jgi:TetR/AcrR family transcriptional regulator